MSLGARFVVVALLAGLGAGGVQAAGATARAEFWVSATVLPVCRIEAGALLGCGHVVSRGREVRLLRLSAPSVLRKTDGADARKSLLNQEAPASIAAQVVTIEF